MLKVVYLGSGKKYKGRDPDFVLGGEHYREHYRMPVYMERNSNKIAFDIGISFDHILRIEVNSLGTASSIGITEFYDEKVVPRSFPSVFGVDEKTASRLVGYPAMEALKSVIEHSRYFLTDEIQRPRAILEVAEIAQRLYELYQIETAIDVIDWERNNYGPRREKQAKTSSEERYERTRPDAIQILKEKYEVKINVKIPEYGGAARLLEIEVGSKDSTYSLRFRVVVSDRSDPEIILSVLQDGKDISWAGARLPQSSETEYAKILLIDASLIL